MEEKQFKALTKVLNSIDSKLSILINLQKSTIKTPDLGKEEKIILKLCNGKNTIENMVKVCNKTKNNIKVTMNHLKKKGMVKSAKINKKIVYVKI